MRIQVPTDFSEDNVTVTANILFVHFANDLGAFIDKFMTTKHGVAWLQDLRVSDSNYKNFNPKDPAALLKDLARYGGSKLRPALNSKIERGFLKGYYEDLDDLLGERNAWLHRQVQETKAELLDLIANLRRVSEPLGLKIVEDCVTLQNRILNPIVESVLPIETISPLEIVEPKPEPEVLAVENQKPIAVEEIMEAEQVTSVEIQALANDERFQIGETVNEKLLSHSYVLHINGDIRDRVSDELLSVANPIAAQSLGALLIARKPTGGRIRITEEGVLCAFFGEKWGYLAQVKSEDWFPNHLLDNVQDQ